MDQTLINHAITELTSHVKRARKNHNLNRVFIDIEENDFWQLLKLNAEMILLQRGKKHEFIVDNENRNVIRELYNYVTGNENFKANTNHSESNLYKGILLLGGWGTGKTILIESVCEIINLLSRKRITFINAKKLKSITGKEEIDKYLKRPMFIDDIGKEDKETRDYGDPVYPLIDLISQRYDFGAWTFGTSNFSFKTLGEMYGEFLQERIIEMFNIIELKGKSRRR